MCAVTAPLPKTRQHRDMVFHVEQAPQKIARKLEKMGFTTSQITRLGQYEGLIQQWQKAINLVSPSTLSETWERHILDSAQMWPVIRDLGLETKVIDLGSGGGLPGIVLGVAGV